MPTFDVSRNANYYFMFNAGVAKLVYALDSKSSGLNAHVGSTPTLGTKLQEISGLRFRFAESRFLKQIDQIDK